jgi:hypothetical protein
MILWACGEAASSLFSTDGGGCPWQTDQGWSDEFLGGSSGFVVEDGCIQIFERVCFQVFSSLRQAVFRVRKGVNHEFGRQGHTGLVQSSLSLALLL